MAYSDDGDTRQSDSRFMRRAMAEPLLTREREFELARAWRREGDEAALHELIRCYTRLVVATAGRFRSYGLPMNDLVQEGTIGLMQAAGRFEPEREFRFSTYASWWIRAAMQDYVLRNWSIVRIGTTASQRSLFFNLRRLRAQIDKAGGVSESDMRADVALALSAPESEVAKMSLRLAGRDQSLNGSATDDSDLEMQDRLVDAGPGPEALAISGRDTALRGEWIRDAVAELPQREQAIIKARRLCEDSSTLEELGRVLGISKERVRQLEQRALLQLRSLLLARVDRVGDLFAEL